MPNVSEYALVRFRRCLPQKNSLDKNGIIRVIIDSVMTDLVILTVLLGGPAYGYALKRTAGLIFGNGELHNNLGLSAVEKVRSVGLG